MADGIHKTYKISDDTYRIDEDGIANCYLLLGSKKALLIDTGDGVGNLKESVDALTKLPLVVVLTHRHCDHAGGRNWFKDYAFHKNDNHWIYQLESTQLASKKLAGMSGRKIAFSKKPYHAKAQVFDDTCIFDLGDRLIRVMNVPGHTKGSVCFIDEKEHRLFTGDEVNPWLWLQLPGCTSVKTWLPNAKKILSLADQFQLYCGHNDGLVKKEEVARLVQCGEELLAGKPYIKVSRGVYAYPDNLWKEHPVIWFKKIK